MGLDVICYSLLKKLLRKPPPPHGSEHAYYGDDPIPERGISRNQLEYPTEDVTLAYLYAINKGAVLTRNGGHGLFLCSLDSFTDKAFEAVIFTGGGYGSDNYNKVCLGGRVTGHKMYNSYLVGYNTKASTKDFAIVRYLNGSLTVLATQSVDIPVGTDYYTKISIAGSAIKAFRADPTTPKISATDTSLASGSFGGSETSSGDSEPPVGQIIGGKLIAPSSPKLPAITIIEAEIENGEPVLMRDLHEISKLSNLPEFLYNEVRKYEILKKKGFKDEEIEILLDGLPQIYVDLLSVSWELFDYNEKAHGTALLAIVGDNVYKSGAVEKQKEYVRNKGLKVINPPKDYDEAILQYNQLKKDFPYWMAGKENYAYHMLGYEELECLAVADFYFGELIEHKTHYSQMKHVSDWELRRTIEKWLNKLENVRVLTHERNKHIKKLKEVLKLGW